MSSDIRDKWHWCQVTLISGHVDVRSRLCQVTFVLGDVDARWRSWQVALVTGDPRTGDACVRWRWCQVTQMTGDIDVRSPSPPQYEWLLLWKPIPLCQMVVLSNMASLHLWASFWSYLQNENSFYVGGFMWISDYSPGWDTAQLSSKGQEFALWQILLTGVEC